MRLTFWGVRGSLPVPGPETLRFGGNTTCLELELADGGLVVLDAGTGIRPLGLRRLAMPPRQASLLLSHLHWDHLLGFPFFPVLYEAGWQVRVGGCPGALEGLQKLFDTRQGDGHFPVRFENLPARIEALATPAGQDTDLGSAGLRCIRLNHPQGGLGFRFEEQGQALVFLTDNELGGPGAPRLGEFVDFCQGAKALVHDAQYLPEELPARRGWGHSSWQEALELARLAGVPRLILTHHDPARDDAQVEALTAQARAAAPAGIQVEAAREGLALELGALPA